MRAFQRLISVALLLSGWSAIVSIATCEAKTPSSELRSAEKIRQICSKQPLVSSVVGVFAVTMEGDTLACINPGLKLGPWAIGSGLQVRDADSIFRLHY